MKSPLLRGLVALTMVGAYGAGLVVIARAGHRSDPFSRSRSAPAPVQTPAQVDDALAKVVLGKVVKTLAITQDCTVLAYLPDWNHGEVDWIGVANNDGGVRVLLDWDQTKVSEEDATSKSRKFLLALYARETQSQGEAGTIHLQAVQAEWPEMTSWNRMPAVADEVAVKMGFEASVGWKLFDITPLVLSRVKQSAKTSGLLMRFADEALGADDWSGYTFVSRQGAGEHSGHRPTVLVVDPK